MTRGVANSEFEAVLIIVVLAVVVTERLPIEVTEETEWFNAHLDLLIPRLSSNHKLLKAVGVDATLTS